MIFDPHTKYPEFHTCIGAQTGLGDNAVIVRAIAKALFALAYAQQHDEAQQAHEAGESTKRSADKLRDLGSMAGRDWMDVLPARCDPNAEHEAVEIARALLDFNPGFADLTALYEHGARAQIPGPHMMTKQQFGHSVALQAVGSGAGLYDYGPDVDSAVRVPYHEFSGLHLFHDYF